MVETERRGDAVGFAVAGLAVTGFAVVVTGLPVVGAFFGCAELQFSEVLENLGRHRQLSKSKSN